MSRIAAGAAKKVGKNELTGGGTLPGQTASELKPNNCLNNLRSSARFLSPQKLASGWPTILRLMATCPFVGTDPTITSGSAVIRADQRLLGHFGKRRAACVSLQSPLLHLGDIV
jgi:hypothetical protein